MGEPREKTPGTPASRTWLVSHVASAGLETTPDTKIMGMSMLSPAVDAWGNRVRGVQFCQVGMVHH